MIVRKFNEEIGFGKKQNPPEKKKKRKEIPMEEGSKFYRVEFPLHLINFVYVIAENEDEAYEKVLNNFKVDDILLNENDLQNLLTIDGDEILKYKGQFLEENEELTDCVIMRVSDYSKDDDYVVKTYLKDYDRLYKKPEEEEKNKTNPVGFQFKKGTE
jgi:hypothetical protein